TGIGLEKRKHNHNPLKRNLQVIRAMHPTGLSGVVS
ncbi:MAG: hypothetical protein ACI9Z9_000850, partial [Litorivivens sp.]